MGTRLLSPTEAQFLCWGVRSKRQFVNILWFHLTEAARHLVCLDPDAHDRAQWPVFFNAMPGIETKDVVAVDASCGTVRVLSGKRELPDHR